MLSVNIISGIVNSMKLPWVAVLVLTQLCSSVAGKLLSKLVIRLLSVAIVSIVLQWPYKRAEAYYNSEVFVDFLYLLYRGEEQWKRVLYSFLVR